MQHTFISPNDKIQPGQQQLTPTQRAAARQFVQAWSDALLSPAPADEAEAEAQLRQAYQVARLEPPQHIRWFDSPLAFGNACLAPENEHSIWNDLQDGAQASAWNSRWDGVRQRVWSLPRSRLLLRKVEPDRDLSTNLWDQDTFSAIVQARVHLSLGRHLETGLRDSLWTHIQERGWDGDEMRARLLTRLSHIIWQSLWAYQLAAKWASYCFLQDWFEDNPLVHLARLHLLVSGAWLGSQEAWLVRKPTRLECDQQGRLHCATGPAVHYPDDWRVSAWHGVRVPHQVILAPETLTKAMWLAEPNVEARRAMQELLGHERFITLMGGVCIDHGTGGDLFEVPLSVSPELVKSTSFEVPPGVDPERVAHYVRVKDASTERSYYLRVPPWIRRADEAVAWTFGLSAAEYHLTQET